MPIRKIRRFDSKDSTCFKLDSCIQGECTNATISSLESQQNHPSISLDSELACKPCDRGHVFADAELTELMNMLWTGRNTPTLDMSESRSCSSDPACEIKSETMSECCTPMVTPPHRVISVFPMPPPRRFYRGFWYSIAKRVLAKASGGGSWSTA